MEELFETYYDAHIKTHQRHMLISWLESAKSEKIRELSSMAVPLDKRYDIPTDIPQKTVIPSFADKSAISKLFENISVGIDMPDTISLKEYENLEQAELEELFSKFIINAQAPQIVTIDDQTEENKKAIQDRFADINVHADVPQAVTIDDQTEENKKAIQDRFADINVHADVQQALTIDDQTEENKKAIKTRFSEIKTAVEIPKTKKIEKQNFDPTYFEGVKAFSDNIDLPKNIKIDKTINLKIPNAVPLPEISNVDFTDILDASKADGVSLRRTETQ